MSTLIEFTFNCNGQLESERQIIVDLADMKVSQEKDTVLVTFALGSCVAVIAWDRRLHIGGMVHYMLPTSTGHQQKALEKPAMFADIGVQLLFEGLYKLGCQKKHLVVKAAGGGAYGDVNGVFNIGKKNYIAMRKIMWRLGILVNAEDIGGNYFRTARLYLNTGKVTITNHEGVFEL